MIMSMCITFDTVSLYLSIYLEKIIADMGKDACTRLCTEASFLIAERIQAESLNLHQ